MSEYEVYKGLNDRKVYVAVPAEIDPKEAIGIANKHLKLNKLCINVEAGYTRGNDLFLGYPDDNDKKATPVWVVSKKAR